jgi:dihydroorotate dehydrogenase electron transfer subunit
MVWLQICAVHPPFGEVQPGQFAMLRPVCWENDPVLGRPFSILAASERGLEFLFRVAGRGTARLAQLEVGQEMVLVGPSGTPFPPPDAAHETILVAGGVGLPPLLMWAERARAAGFEPVRFIYGARTGDDLVLSERVHAATHRLRCVSEDGSVGPQGLTTTPGLATTVLCAQIDETRTTLRTTARAKQKNLRVFACGPSPMLAAVAEIAVLEQVECRVSLETRMACGRGVCLGCAQQDRNGDFFLVCADGPVVLADQVDWPKELQKEKRQRGT